jgi:hypothetical protein
MNYDTSSIEREIADTRKALAGQLSEVEEKVRDVVDWRTHFRSHPLPFLGGAAMVGFAASTLVGRARNGSSADVVNTTGSSARHVLASSQVPSRAGQAFEQLADVLIAVGAAKVAKYVDAWLPGFHEEFNRRG